jgi:hypothetical protein
LIIPFVFILLLSTQSLVSIILPHTIIIPTSNMHVNKRIGRFKQWAGERMGGEAKTCLSDDFKAMETEMGVRHEGRK